MTVSTPKHAARKPAGNLETRKASEVAARGISHAFGEQTVLRDVDMVAKPGEFVTLLGPSGSGKTTLLRIIAGLVIPDVGTVHVDDTDVTHDSVQARNMGLVFQSYALFPHMTVAENVAFPLKMKRVGKRAQRERVAEMLQMVALDGLAARRPSELSGGQQQRVALARAMAHSPRVLLLDEPLGALDRRLRQHLGQELRRVQREMGTTSIYVTHDQEEAFVLSDKVIVMGGGIVHQAGPPDDLYDRPADLFVAQFLGDTNRFQGHIRGVESTAVSVDIAGRDVTCAWHAGNASTDRDPMPGQPVTCVLRPENLVVMQAGDSSNPQLCELGAAEVHDRIYMGSRYRLIVQWQDSTLLIDTDREARVSQIGDTISIASRRGAMVALPNDPT